MGINDLQLTTDLIALLYPETLINGKTRDSSRKIAGLANTDLKRVPEYPFLGGNKRAVCFLVHYPEVAFVPEEQFVFIQKILSACKLNMDDIALINGAHHSVTLEELINQFHPKTILLWGVSPQILGNTTGLPDMQVSDQNGITFLPVSEADRMMPDNPEGRALKKRLWISLKKIFNL